MNKILKIIFYGIGFLVVLFLLYIVIVVLSLSYKQMRLEERRAQKIDLTENREKYLASDNNLFVEPQIVKEVGVTKYNDFYIITDKGYALFPYGRRLVNNLPAPAYPRTNEYIYTDDIRLSNLNKLLNKEIKVSVLANKNLKYEFKINSGNKEDVYPLDQSNYYMVDINDNGFYLDMNFNLCNPTSSVIEGFHCDKEIDSIYPRQKWWNGEKN